MIKNRDILVVGQQPWDVEIGSNCKDIAKEFSKNNRVLYVNPPLDRITKVRHYKKEEVKRRLDIINGFKDGLIKVDSNLWVFYPNVLIESINWIGIHQIFLFFNKRNNLRFAKSILEPLSLLDFSDFILFNDSDIFRSLHLKELLKPDITIYYSRDNILATDYWKRHGRRVEPKLIEKSDICFSNSEYLSNYCKRYNANSHNVGQGCDLSVFMDRNIHEVPEELENINGPLIGYVGALTSMRLDIELIAYIANSLPDSKIVLVGPQDDDFLKSTLHFIKNVIFVPARKLEELPLYISLFDVCINPQILNELTIGNYPRKVDEYLAMGKPVVGTRTEMMVSFEQYVFLASDKDEFVAGIKNALLSNSVTQQKERQDFALSHSWENSVNKMYNQICLFQNRTTNKHQLEKCE